MHVHGPYHRQQNIFCNVIPVNKAGELVQEDGDMAAQIFDKDIGENVSRGQSSSVH